MKIKKNIFMAMTITLVSLGIGISVSSFTAGDSVTNKFEVGEIDIEVNEEFTPDSPWNKGEVKKIVSINNVSVKNDCLVRVSIVPRWVEIIEGKEVPWSGDTNLVTLELDNIIKEPPTENNKWEKNKWYESSDGYYYYTSQLKKQEGDTPTSKILNSVTVDVDLKKYPEYINKVLIVDVNSEAVQPTEQAYIDSWPTIDDTVKNLLKNAITNG